MRETLSAKIKMPQTNKEYYERLSIVSPIDLIENNSGEIKNINDVILNTKKRTKSWAYRIKMPTKSEEYKERIKF